MASIQPYEIVLSLAGHDQGKLFCVIGAEEDFVLLADGKGEKAGRAQKEAAETRPGRRNQRTSGNRKIAERRADH